ncbi:Fe-S cluster assembly sulfur transfer protein SufU [Psychromicrobium lacuslunae]|uniref:Nitrogen fixation protein NifU n=1 Tax=Psychromicrobium lacuslunae TaxID=1618207 RepID=A0A0D4BVU8_9MICC|nr:SUF system NifU family Fe-S cluster assembly protein [Psychromicrobium lacuslunae]AJT40443.1 nitrogen fixation protein NifU [Psychromicrobium lacuslunae]
MSGLDSLYQSIILEHSKARHGSPLEGHPAAPGLPTASSHQLNPVCGDEITLRIEVDGEKIKSVRWDGAGCAISMASASVLSDLFDGLDRSEAMELIEEFRAVMRSRGQLVPDEEVLGEAAAFGGVARYAARVKCAMLSWVAAEDALRQL